MFLPLGLWSFGVNFDVWCEVQVQLVLLHVDILLCQCYLLRKLSFPRWMVFFFFNHAFFLFQNNYWLFLSPTVSCAHTYACIHTDTHIPAILSWRNGHLHCLREASMQPRALPLIPRILSQTELCFLRLLYVLVHLPVGVFKSFRGREWRRSRRWHRDPHWRSVFSQLYFQLPSQM